MIIFPFPKEYNFKEEYYTLPERPSILCPSKKVLRYISEFMCSEPSQGDADIKFELDEALKKEEYKITMSENDIIIRGGDEEALFRGAQTLKQIVLQEENGKVQCINISDKPDIERRGIMLDVSRGRIQKPAEIKRLIDIMADMKYNELQLYFDKIVYEY